MRRITGVIVLAFMLAGCITPEQQAEADRMQCMKYGFKSESNAFASCMMTLSTNRQSMMEKDFADQDARYQQERLISALRDINKHKDHHSHENKSEHYDTDTSPHFDKSGNPNYDTQGNYDGCHGAGCLVDPPDEGL